MRSHELDMLGKSARDGNKSQEKGPNESVLGTQLSCDLLYIMSILIIYQLCDWSADLMTSSSNE